MIRISLSTTSTILLGLLLLAFGTLFAPRLQNKKRLFVIAATFTGLLFAGSSFKNNEVHAGVDMAAFSIMTPNGPSERGDIVDNAVTRVTNNYPGGAVRITEINDGSCPVIAGYIGVEVPSCAVDLILENGDSCDIETYCPEIEVDFEEI